MVYIHLYEWNAAIRWQFQLLSVAFKSSNCWPVCECIDSIHLFFLSLFTSLNFIFITTCHQTGLAQCILSIEFFTVATLNTKLEMWFQRVCRVQINVFLKVHTSCVRDSSVPPRKDEEKLRTEAQKFNEWR